MTINRTTVIAIAAAVLASPSWLVGQGKPAAALKGTAGATMTRGASVEGITEYSLSNGMRVLLFPDASKPTVTVNVTYFVGSRHEGYGETGMAHLLEHLQFKGTPSHRNIPSELDAHGASFNASTSYDRTNYYETMPATEANVQWALELEADRMLHSFIAKRDLDSEFSVVRSEFEIRENSPDNVLAERVMSTAYLWHNYGKSTIGARSDIEQVPITRLQAFYKKYYQPDNAMLVVAGKFDPEKTLAKITRVFGPLPRPDRTGASTLYPTYTAEPVQDGERSVLLRRSGDKQTLAVAYHVPAGAHPDMAALDVLASILSTAPTGRFYKALVEPKLATSASAQSMQLREPSLFFLSADIQNSGSLDTARTVLFRTIDDIATHPITAEEVERARALLLASWDLAFNAPDRIGVSLSEWASIGDWRLLFLQRDRWKQVTAADVQRVATTYLKASNRTVGMFIPAANADRVDIPVAPDVAEQVKNYKGNAAVAAGEAFDASPANIEARTTRTKLSNGVTLALLPKKSRGEAVSVAMTFHFGNERSLQGRGTAANMVGAMLFRGSARHTRQQIRDEFVRLKAAVNVHGTATGVGVTITTTRSNLLPTLALVREILREPAFDAKEFEQVKQEQIASLEAMRSEPQMVAITAFQKRINQWTPSDPRYVASPTEQVAAFKAVTLDSVKAFHRDFYGSSTGDIAVVGDFDPAAVKDSLESAYAGWKSATPYERLRKPYHDLAPLDTVVEVPDKTSAIYLVGQSIPMTDMFIEYPALAVASYIFGGGALDSRMATRLRQKEGLSYVAQAQIAVPAQDTAGIFVGAVMHAPQNVAKVDRGFREELNRFVNDGVTQAELDKARTALIHAAETGRAEDAGIAQMLIGSAYLNRTLQHDAEFEGKMKVLTVAQVNAAIKKYLRPDRLLVVKVGDFSGAKTDSVSAPASSSAPTSSLSVTTGDTLTIAMAKKLGPLTKKIDSVAVAKNVQVLPVMGNDPTVPLTKLINDSPDLLASVKAAGLTVDTYVKQSMRIRGAQLYDALEKAVARKGMSIDQVPGIVKPTAEDLAFIRAKSKELKEAGFEMPDLPL